MSEPDKKPSVALGQKSRERRMKKNSKNTFSYPLELKNERLKSGCYNVVLIDWMWGNTFDMEISKRNVPIVAKQTVIIIRNLKANYEKNGQSQPIILSGHSYGAHLAGVIGNLTEIDIINGLEPAGGAYTENTPLAYRLDAGDAKCVQALHTNAGQCIPAYFGVNFTLGTFDVFYNDGLNQPSCMKITLYAFLKQDYVYGLFHLLPAACNHFQVLEYYKASMNPTNCQFAAVKCGSYNDFKAGKCSDCGGDGENCVIPGAYGCDCLKSGQRGNYWLKTTLDCPYCTNKNIDTTHLSCPAGRFPPPQQS